jgi:hypothetical protein
MSFGWQCTGSFAFFFDQSFTHARIPPAALILTHEFVDQKSSNVALLWFLVMGHPRAVASPGTRRNGALCFTRRHQNPRPPSVLALFIKISGKIHFYDSEGRIWIFPLEVVVEGPRVLIRIFCIFLRGKLRHKINFMDQVLVITQIRRRRSLENLFLPLSL